jgi:hypothetical protein
VNSRIGDLDINWLQPVAEEAAKLAKVGPVDEARDEHGEWTSGGGGEGKVNTTPVKFTDGSGHDVVVAPEDFESRYPKISAEQEVSGLKVRNHVPNTDSIDATFNDPVVLSGIREVPFSDFTGPDKPTERTRALADSINESGEINPLIVGIDEKGPWIVEGGHRYDSLQFLGKKTFPAKVVLDGELFKARKLAKADDDEDIDWGYAADIADGLDLSGLSVMVDPVSQQGAQVSGSTATIALGQFGMDDNDVVNRVNERAAAWAALRAAEMVGMRYDAQGNLVPSRDASKRIDTATRNMLRQTIGDGLAAGQTVDEIGRDIYDGYGFSEERAALIANTEVRRASNQGALEGYAAIKSSGVPLKKEWLVADSPCEECEGNADDGAIGIDETFSSGDDAPPGHPNCQCTLIPVTDDEGNDTEEAARPFDLAKWLSINYHKLRKDGPVDEPRDDHGRWTSGGGGGGEYRNVHSTRDLLSHFSDKDASVDDVIDSVKGTKEIDGKQLTAREAVEYNRERIAAGTSTDDLASGFKNADGTWTDQREALHQDIINRMFSEQAIEGAQPAAGEAPTMNMLGGRGGSGKGWITESGPLAGDRSIVIDADKIKEALGYHGWDAALYHEESSEIADKALGMARSMKLNVTYDATMRTGISSIQRASSFAEAGYNVRGYYMFSPPEQAARQALTRYMSGGRFVDPKYTFDSRSNEQSFDSVIPHLSSYQVYDGRSRTPKLVASGGK